VIKTYIFLIGAIFCEVAGTMLLPASQNFTKLIPTISLAIFYLTAFYLLTFVVNKLPIAIVYATWSGLGIFTIAILGYIFFRQSLAWQAVIGLFLIVIGVILVNSYTLKTIL
tara:strand:- start:77 stop:412 length:336 start_codon:yes stop_codon:yes gene_type:complete